MKLLLAALALPSFLFAHALTVETDVAAPAVVLRATYDGAEPAGRADVMVYPPGTTDNPYQSGSTDAKGVFAFVPSEAGVWTAVVDDGFGHRSEVTVDWAGAGGSQAESSRGSTWRDALTGVSLLIGLTGIWLWRQSRARG